MEIVLYLSAAFWFLSFVILLKGEQEVSSTELMLAILACILSLGFASVISVLKKIRDNLEK